MKKALFTLVLVIAMAMFLIGCSTNNWSNATEGVVTISPSSLFKGNTKILEPHLGIIGGDVKVQYQGSKKFMVVSGELWENGKLESNLGSLESPVDGSFDGDVSVSLSSEGSDNSSHSFREVIEISQKSGSGTLTGTVPKFSSQDGSGPKKLSGPTKVNDNQKIAVWGLLAEKGPGFSGTYGNNDSIEEMARRADWAFVLSVSFTDKAPPQPRSSGIKQG